MSKDDKPYFIIHVDRDILNKHSKKVISTFLKKLHIYKSIGDKENAEKFFHNYTQVDDEMLKIREVVIKNRMSRRLEVQPNLFR